MTRYLRYSGSSYLKLRSMLEKGLMENRTDGYTIISSPISRHIDVGVKPIISG